MNGTMKVIVIAAASTFAGSKVAETFTDEKDSASERLMWQVAAAALVAVLLTKAL